MVVAKTSRKSLRRPHSDDTTTLEMNLPYPESRTEDSRDTLSGVSFPDPYRWLESDSEETRQWQRVQSVLATAQARDWAHFARLQELVAQFTVERFVVLPRYAGGQWFRLRRAEDTSHTQVLVSGEPMGPGRVLFDTNNGDLDQSLFVSWIAPSPDARTLALGVCRDGSENNTITLIDVEAGRFLPDPPVQTLMDSFTGGIQWLPDSSGFFFSGITGPAVNFAQDVYLHRRAAKRTTVKLAVPWTNKARDYRMVLVSRDGQYAIAIERIMNPIPVAIARLGEYPLRWRPFVTSLEGTLAGHPLADCYIAVTDVRAPRGRLVAVALRGERPDDPQTWRELVPESDAVLRTVTPVGKLLYLTEFVDTYARVRIVDLEGRELAKVPLPGLGAISELPFPMMNLVPKGHPDRFLFGLSTLTAGPGIYSHSPVEDRLETLQAPQVHLPNTAVDECWAVSSDGTRIPYHVVYRKDVDAGRHRPTLIHAYGGFNAPLVPQFPGPMAAFVAAGGVFVHAHLRGGGELGLEWWRGGRMGHKQQCYNDLCAVAENLIATQVSSPRLLALTGSSNGGLMAGVALTQRPDLWSVVVPRVPILDLIGACRDPYGRMGVVSELAQVDDPSEVRRLASFSPYHLVRDGLRYPAVFIEAGDTDPRCPAWHARKFAARLQAATSSNAPVLLHVWENAGHGWATEKRVLVAQYTEWLAFTFHSLGLEPSLVGDCRTGS